MMRTVRSEAGLAERELSCSPQQRGDGCALRSRSGSCRRRVPGVVLLAGLAMPLAAQNPPTELTEKSLEDLMNMQVSSASKREQKLSQVAAAVFAHRDRKEVIGATIDLTERDSGSSLLCVSIRPFSQRNPSLRNIAQECGSLPQRITA